MKLEYDAGLWWTIVSLYIGWVLLIAIIVLGLTT